MAVSFQRSELGRPLTTYGLSTLVFLFLRALRGYSTSVKQEASCLRLFHPKYGIYTSKRMQHNLNFVYHFLISNATQFYGLPLDLCGKRIAALFAKRAAIFLQFGEMRRIFTEKAQQSLGLRRFSTRHTFRNCGTHRRVSAVHGTPR